MPRKSDAHDPHGNNARYFALCDNMMEYLSTMPKPHKWEYHELPPVPPTEGARPAQRCARCGMVRRFGDTFWWYQRGEFWHDWDTEPPCVPQETPATPTERP